MNKEEYDYDNPGTLYRDGRGDHWLKPAQLDRFHLDGMVVNLFDGSLTHYSKLPDPVVAIYGHEVQW